MSNLLTFEGDIFIELINYSCRKDIFDTDIELAERIIKFLDIPVEHDDTFSYITSKDFLRSNSYEVLREKILKEKRIVSIIDIGAYFKSIKDEQIIITIQNNFVENNHISIYKYIENEFVKQLEIPQSFYENEILLFDFGNSSKNIEVPRKSSKGSIMKRLLIQSLVSSNH